jgi:3-oxoacyl-[acyl-carrier-protein] synthase III
VQRDLGLRTVGVDVKSMFRFCIPISVADQYIKTGMYKNILVVVLRYILLDWI